MSLKIRQYHYLREVRGFQYTLILNTKFLSTLAEHTVEGSINNIHKYSISSINIFHKQLMEHPLTTQQGETYTFKGESGGNPD